MSKKIVKLNKKQLRGLISEAFTSIPFGEAAKYFDEMMTPEVNEAPKSVTKRPFGPNNNANANTDNIAAMDEFIHEVEVEWGGLYDDGDPTMVRLGRVAWDQQVSSACDHLVDLIQKALNDTETMLTDGEFYIGDRSRL